MTAASPLVLAYLGDSIFEIYVREKLILSGILKTKELQKEAINYVSAKSQAKCLKELLETNFFYEDELEIIRRARNYKSSSHPKNTDILTYKHATALEALIGYLYLANNIERVDEIMTFILNKDELLS